MAPPPPAPGRRYWHRTTRLMILSVGLCIALGGLLPLAASWIMTVLVAGIPAGFLIAAEGSLAGLVLLAFWHAGRQNRIDEDCHVAED